jgi:sugar diacid utilization regulator
LAKRDYLPASRQKGLDIDLILGVLHGTVTDPGLPQKIMKQIGFREETYFIVYTSTNVNTEGNAFLLPSTAELLMSDLENTFAVADGAEIILFVNEQPGPVIQDKIAGLISYYLGAYETKTGVSLGFTEPGLLSACYHQALAAAQYGKLADRNGRVFAYSDVAAYDVLGKYGDQEALLSACHPSALLLYRHDQNNRMDLLASVKAFIECAGNTEKISERLYVHRNTVYYRMRTAENLTGLNFTDGTSHFHVLLSIYILEFLGGLKPAA